MIGAVEMFMILFIPVFVFLAVFWLWMLIDCLKRPDDQFKTGGNNARLVWVLVIILTGLIGAIIYYFLIKKIDSHEDRIIGIALVISVAMVIFFIASQFVVTTRSTFSIEPYPPGKLPQSVEIPTIMAIQPDTGTIGTKIVITGTGFTARDNNVAFRREPEDAPAASYQVGYINNLVSSDGRTIEFVIPELLGACAYVGGPPIVCPAIGLTFKPGTQTYPVYVVNQNGTSNSVNFTVSRKEETK